MNRIQYLDFLRIISIFSMIILHLSAGGWAEANPETFDWQVFNAFDSLVRFCVPIFIMISGCLLLDPNREINIKNIFRKNILRLTVAYLCWSFFYAIFKNWLYYGSIGGIESEAFKVSFINGNYHMWFIPTIIGLYIITPLLRKLTADKKILEYFLILSFIFTSVIPLLMYIPTFAEDYTSLIGFLDMSFVTGFVFYYLMGYYLHTYDIKSSMRKLIYVMGAISLLIIIFGSIWTASYYEAPATIFMDYTSPSCAIYSTAIFIFFKNNSNKIRLGEKAKRIITKLAYYSFGIYLVHDFFITILNEAGLQIITYNPILSIPFIAILVYLMSLVFTAILSKIPIANKYLM